ncbi:MAG: cytochrome c [Elusimicrobiota bacterium]|nr:cytochrome c [Elusimicrobiota bacterium]
MLFGALALILAASSAAASPNPALLFDAHGCRACHKIGAPGGNAGPDLTLVGHRRPRAWLEKWLASPRAYKHDTEMPEQGLNASDRVALAEFLSAQKGQAWGKSRPWEAGGDGRTIYIRAGCVACHGPAGRGGHPNPGAHGDVIPALAPLMGTYKKDELIWKLRRGVVPETHGGPPADVDMPRWDGVFDEAELGALADYLLTLAKTDPKDDF